MDFRIVVAIVMIVSGVLLMMNGKDDADKAAGIFLTVAGVFALIKIGGW